MSFEVAAEAYGRFMGRYSEPLAGHFADLAHTESGQRALDVGCGPGALTAVLAERLGPTSVAAVDPSESFLSAVRVRLPGLDARKASAEHLPFANDTFDITLAQLVVHFMTDPEAGIREMARVTRPGGTVAACVWDHAGGLGPLSAFWRAARDLDPSVHDESDLPGTRDGQLVELFERVGLSPVKQTILTVRASFADVDEWWQPLTLGVGPAGVYVATLDTDHRTALRARCAALLATGHFDIEANAWAASAHTKGPR
jgi:SAM-dependent methyltransferase